MENIRSAIKERIKSCISCDVQQCPIIKQRLDQHVMSHHSSASHAYSNQKVNQNQSYPRISTDSKITIVKLDDSPSTSDFGYEQSKKKSNNTNNYKQNLKQIISEWSNDIPNISKDTENTKQNKINELIEKIYELKTEINKIYYESKLRKVIEELLSSMLAQTDDEVTMSTLKENLVTDIQELNNQIENMEDDITKFKSDLENNNETKDIAVNTLKTAFKRKVEGSSKEYKDKSTQNSLNDSLIGDLTTKESNKNNNKVYIDNQVQHTLSNVFPFYANINTVLKKQNPDETEEDKVQKRCIFNWLLKLNKEGLLNFDQEDIYYDSIMEDLFNSLKPILNLKSYRFDKNNLLKDEIFKFTLRNINMSLNANDIVNLSKLANTLAINLLNKNYYVGQNKYSENGVHKIIETHNEEDFDVLRLINDVVVNSLVSNGIYSDQLINNIIECIINNVNSTGVFQNQSLNTRLSNYLKNSTGLSETDSANIINNITTEISKLYYKLDLSKKSNETWRNNVISVYKSEVDLMAQSNNTNSMTRRKSSIAKNKNGKLNPEEINYMNKLSAAITSWLDVLPMGSRKAKNKKNKQNFVQNLTSDILDQVKLHSLIEENSEKDRYIAFFIYRWLNRYELIENIDEAKPFVNQLLKEIIDIPEPIRNEETKDITLENGIFNDENSLNITEEFSKLKDRIIHTLNDLSPKNIKIKDKIKKKKIIDDLLLQVQKLITEKQSISEISQVINNYITQIINSDQKQIIAKINKDVTDTVKKCLQNIHLVTSHQTNTDDKVKASKEILKNYILKYLDHRFDPEDSIARVAFTQLLKNELDSLSTPVRRPHDSTTNYKQEEFLIDKLSKELEYINIIIDWLKSLPLEESFYTIDLDILARSINKLGKDMYEIEENLSSNGNRDRDITSEIVIFLEQLPISPQNRKNVSIFINDLASKITNIKMSQGTCCQLPDCQTDSSVGKQSETEHDMSNFIEEYIRNNSDEISQDDLKLEACILRFFDEIDQKETEQVQLSKSLVLHNANDVKELENNEAARRFSFELGYANEISQWLKNLPLIPIIHEQSRTQVGNMVSSLAQKVFEKQMENTLSQNENDLVDYISNWIVALPLDPAKNIDLPVAVQQLLKRLERVDIDKYQIYSKREKDLLNKIHVISKSHACCGNQEDLGSTIIDEVETWCNSLPLEPENENNNNTLKQNVATKLYQKIRELNMNPEYFNDDLLYRELLNTEIERLLDDLPPSSKLQSLKDVLKKELLNGIMEKRNEIREKSSAIEYRHDLEKTIDISMPHPVATYLKESPGFKIYKDRLASMFILENFDYANDSVKQKYEERLKIEIDKYYEDVQVRNSIPLSKDQIYNELYSALFSVPLPNESSIIVEVEEIKTRCEIDNWFETLPLNEAAGVGELLEWDQILAMLAKRLHEMEKIECGRETKMHNEITKWLLRLPLLPCQKRNIDYFANDLQSRLKATQQNRKCLSHDVNRTDQCSSNNSDENNENSKNVQPLGSRIYKDTPSSISLLACCQTSPSLSSKPPQSLPLQDSKNPADIIIKIVETWCQKLPLSSTTPQERAKFMKENIAIKIIMKISEMNMNPEIFEDDFLYSGLLEDELDNQLAKLPTNLEFNKLDAKIQLINAVESVKPLIKEEKSRYEYKHELKNTIDNILNVSQTENSKTTTALASVRDEIADDFIVFEFQTRDNESSQIKDKIYQRIQNFIQLNNENEESSLQPLVLTNQLICELRKISVPSEFVIIEELKELEIKFEIAKLFDEISLAEDFDKLSNKNQVKSTLAKRLSDFEKLGYTKETCFKMKKEIIKYIRKIDDNEIDTKKVDKFIGTLQKTYPKRMSISHTVPQLNDTNKNTKLAKSIEVGEADFSANTDSKQWRSLLPATPKDKNMQNNQDNYNTLNGTSTSYRTFGTETKALSSVGKDQSKKRLEPNYSRYLYNNDQNAPRPSTISPKRPYRNNMSQNQVSGISDLTNPNRLQNQNTQNKNLKGSAQYQPSLYPNSKQQYTRYQDTEEKYTNTNPYLQNNIQPKKYSRHNQFEDNSFQQLPGVDQGVYDETYKHSLARNVPVTQERPAVDTHDHPNARQLQQDKSLSSQDSIQRRTCRRPSVSIFSPSYLEPNESQETIENSKCKSKKCLEGDKVKVECICEKKEDKIECRCDKKDEDKIECRCDKKYDEKIFCRCDKKYDDKIFCRCAKKGKCKTNWSIDIRKYCKFCNRVHPFDCRMLNYPKCYY